MVASSLLLAVFVLARRVSVCESICKLAQSIYTARTRFYNAYTRPIQGWPITFVAGSLLPIGGHTPYEPTFYSSAIIHGPYFSNFEDVYSKLNKNQGALKVINPKQISVAWKKLRNKGFRDTTILNAENVINKSDEKDILLNLIFEKVLN